MKLDGTFPERCVKRQLKTPNECIGVICIYNICTNIFSSLEIQYQPLKER